MPRAEPGCAFVSPVMDALRFGWKITIILGRLRSPEGPGPRRLRTGELPAAVNFEVHNKLASLLREDRSPRACETAVRRVLTFAIGRELRPSGPLFSSNPSLEQTKKRFGFEIC